MLEIRAMAGTQMCHTSRVWPGCRFIVDLLLTRPRLWRPSAFQGVSSTAEDLLGGAMAQKLFIGGLSFSTSSERLRELFAQAGAVESATVVTDRETGRSRGFGFVEMATADEAEAAVKKFNGQEVDGRTLKVELAKPSGSGGARSGGGGYRSGGRGGSRW